MKACTSSSFGVPYGSLRAGIETFAVYHQSAGRSVGGSSEISRKSLARVLGNRVWLGLQSSASDGCSHRRETFNFPFRGMAEEFSDSSWCVCVWENKAAAEEAFKEPTTRECKHRHVYTCCKACLYCRHRTGAFTFTVSHQWGGKVHQAIIHPGTKQFRVSMFYNSLLRT